MFSLNIVDDTNFKKTTNPLDTDSVEQELQKLKQFFDKGLIPPNIYDQKVSDLLYSISS